VLYEFQKMERDMGAMTFELEQPWTLARQVAIRPNVSARSHTTSAPGACRF
jgi:hypothetical protein